MTDDAHTKIQYIYLCDNVQESYEKEDAALWEYSAIEEYNALDWDNNDRMLVVVIVVDIILSRESKGREWVMMRIYKYISSSSSSSMVITSGRYW